MILKNFLTLWSSYDYHLAEKIYFADKNLVLLKKELCAQSK